MGYTGLQHPGNVEVEMLSLRYWELNENMSEQEHLQEAVKFTSPHMFPLEEVNIMGSDGTTDPWGIVLFEAVNPETAFPTLDH